MRGGPTLLTAATCVALVSVAYQCMGPPTPHVKNPPPRTVTYAGCRVSCPNGGYRMMPAMTADECRARAGSGTCTYREVWKP